MAQGKEVSGIVTNSKGIAEPGITVTVKGTSRVKATDANGTFTITAMERDVLVFTSVSFNSKEVRVTAESTYNVVLSENSAAMGEVVVVGYGRQSRRNLTNSINTLKAEDLNRGAISDVG